MLRPGRVDFTGYLFITTGVALLSLWAGESEWAAPLALIWAAMVIVGLLLFRWRGFLILAVGVPAVLWRLLLAIVSAHTGGA